VEEPVKPNPARPRDPIRSLAVVSLLVVLLAAACSTGGATGTPPAAATSAAASPSAASTTAGPSTGTASPSEAPVRLTVGLGYIPSVQFAQFYLADQAGYYREAGLDVTFQNGQDPDLITLAAQGQIDIAIADGTSLIPAGSQGIPVRYLATIYAKFPNVVFAKSTTGIKSAADLKGRKIGTPGKYGSSWIMLQGLLASANLTLDDVKISTYPTYGQLVGVEQGQVDAATGFANNEPIQLAATGATPVVLPIDSIVPLPGNGLIAGTKTIATKRDALALFISATLRTMTEISADPQKGLDAAIKAVPDLASDKAGQLAVLQATIDMWHGPYTDAQGLGAVDRSAWTRSIAFMAGLPGGLVPNPVTADGIVDDSLLPVR
jgi:NitT/TauT family transport system substrate-binding protein